MRKDPSTPIPHLLNATFHAVDTQLSALSAAEGSHSGCTAVTCLLRLEDENGNPVGEGSGVAPHVVGGQKGKLDGKPGEACEAAEAVGIDPTEGKPGSGEGQHPGGGKHAEPAAESLDLALTESLRPLYLRTGSSHDGSVKSKIKSMLSSSGSKLNSLATSTSSTPSSQNPVSGPAEVVKAAKRTLYTANAGDARAVLW